MLAGGGRGPAAARERRVYATATGQSLYIICACMSCVMKPPSGYSIPLYSQGWKGAEGNGGERLRPLPEVLQRPHRPARWSATAATNTNANVGRSCDARIAPPAKRSPANSSQVHARAQIKSATREHTRSQATCCGGQQAITPRTERRAPDLSRCSRLPCFLPEPASARTHLKGSYRRPIVFSLKRKQKTPPESPWRFGVL